MTEANAERKPPGAVRREPHTWRTLKRIPWPVSKRITITLSAYIATLTAGCSLYTSLPSNGWRVTPELQVAFESAANEWCRQSDGAYCPYIDDSVEQTVSDGSDHPHAPGHCGWRASYPGILGSRQEIRVNLAALADCPPIESTLYHELGHAYGLKETEL